MTGGKSHGGARGGPAWVLLLALAACTEPAERPNPVRISIDADSIVRLNTVQVEIRLEALAPENHQSKTWDSLLQKTFRPDPLQDTDWPWQLTLDPKQSEYARYNLTATARDAQSAVVGRVQAVRELAEARRHGLRMRFDSECFRPAQPCGEGSTCLGGSCVDAASLASSPAADGGMGEPGPRDPLLTTQAASGVAQSGASCKEGERACAEQGSKKPLACEGGVWRSQPECLDNERCDTAQGATRGSCQPVVDQCMNRQANVPYCDGETMRVCVDLVASDVRACAENERCVPEGTSARCACRPGFVTDGTRCIRATECGSSGGGCDPLTLCSMVNGKPACSACPAGYSGTGERGCAPLLQSLTSSAGVLEPAFDPNVHEYRVQVPLLAPRVDLTPTMPSKTTATLDGATLESSGAWASPVLPLGQTKSLALVLTSEFGVSTKYTIALERAGEQLGYVKPTGAASYDQFGSAIDISGDTMVVAAWFEGAGGASRGAAYVLARDGDNWKQQTQLKPSDAADYDYFGTSTDLDGDTLVIGAIHEGLYEANTGPSRLGAAYVYTRTSGSWSFSQRLAGTPQDQSDLFGAGVALAGDTLVVGAPWESTGQAHSGAVYVYQRKGAMWSEVQKIKSSKPAANARFGWSVALDADRLVIGAPDDPPPNMRTGSAEVFVRRAGTWTLSQFLQPQTLGAAANFGYAVSVRGDHVAIGAPRTASFPGSPTPTEPGEVYVFEPDGDGWKQSAMLHARYPRNTDWFGLSLQLTDGALIIGAPGDASGARGLDADASRNDATFSGSVYVFAPSDEGWVESAFIKGKNTDINDWFGSSVASDGRSLAVSAMFENGMSTGLTTGAVYVFH
jgi:hypothetical protein